MATTLQPRRSGSTDLTSRHPVTTFLVTAFGLTTAVLTVPTLAQFEVIPGRSLPERWGLTMEMVASILLILALFAATLLVTAHLGGGAEVRILLRRILRWRVTLVWWVVAGLGLPALTVLIAVLFGDTARVPTVTVLAAELAGLAVGLVLVNLWEESAWTGFMQTHLERRHNFFVAAALTAIPFAAVHMPIRLITGEVRSIADLAIGFVSLAVFGVIIRSLFGMVLRGASNSLALVALTHTMFNRSNNSDGLAADILVGDHRQNAALLATVVLTVVIGVVIRRKLTRTYRLALDETERDHEIRHRG